MLQRFWKKDLTTQERRYPNVCLVYLRRDKKLAVVGSLFGGGVTLPRPERIALMEAPTEEGLGRLALEKFNEFKETDLAGYQNDHPPRKLKNDEFFQASACKTLKEFHADFVYYRLEGVNISNLYIQITSKRSHDEITLMSVVSAFDAINLGARLLKMHHRFLQFEMNSL